MELGFCRRLCPSRRAINCGVRLRGRRLPIFRNLLLLWRRWLLLLWWRCRCRRRLILWLRLILWQPAVLQRLVLRRRRLLRRLDRRGRLSGLLV
jgi:hypothetical protein